MCLMKCITGRTSPGATLSRKVRSSTYSGTVATDENHRTLYKGDLAGQVKYVYETVKGILEKAGASFDDVVKTTNYIAPQAVADYVKTADIRREYFKGNYPAATGVVVHSLLMPDWLIEIEFTAVLD